MPKKIYFFLKKSLDETIELGYALSMNIKFKLVTGYNGKVSALKDGTNSVLMEGGFAQDLSCGAYGNFETVDAARACVIKKYPHAEIEVDDCVRVGENYFTRNKNL